MIRGLLAPYLCCAVVSCAVLSCRVQWCRLQDNPDDPIGRQQSANHLDEPAVRFWIITRPVLSCPVLCCPVVWCRVQDNPDDPIWDGHPYIGLLGERLLMRIAGCGSFMLFCLLFDCFCWYLQSTLNRRSIDAQSTLQSTLNRRLVFIGNS